MAVVFTDAAIGDLRRLGPRVARRALEQVAILGVSPDAGDAVGDAGTPYRKLTGRAGAWRVVYALDGDDVTVWEVWVDTVRSTGAAYAEALHRMQAADTPDSVELAGIIERLGRITGTMPVPRNRVIEPVPDWLADALIDHAGLSALDVAAMHATSAFEAWNARRPDRSAPS